MANKKITELNEATSVSGNDWLVIVDVANDETKKVHANQVGGNIPIQDTAPQDPEEDDLWIDTSEEGFDNSNVVNQYSESTSDVYSCNYVNGIIDSGSNTNGYYIKYADGTMICYGSKSGTTTWSDWWSFAKRTPDGTSALSCTFPQNFIDGNVNVSITTGYGSTTFSASYNSISTTSFSFVCYKPTNDSSTNYAIKYIAVGRWK